MKTVQQLPSARIGQRFENCIHAHTTMYATMWLHVKRQVSFGVTTRNGK
jgi:hypothetical protein